jgi:hypothetical protein
MTALRPAATDKSPVALADGFGPPPPQRRSRNLAGASLGLLLILLCAAGVAIFTVNAGHRRGVLVMTRAVAAGTAIQPGDLGETRVASDSGIHLLASSGRGRVVGRVAAVNLTPGMLVSLDLLSNGSLVSSGHAIVGLALKPGEMPSRLHALDHVMLVQTASASTGTSAADGATVSPAPIAPLVARAQVFAVEAAADRQTTVVSVIVTTDQAPRVASASARDQISVVLLGDSGG